MRIWFDRVTKTDAKRLAEWRNANCDHGFRYYFEKSEIDSKLYRVMRSKQ